MSTPLRIVLLLGMLVAWCPAAARADFHYPTTPPLLKVDNVDIFWKRADQKYIHFTIRVFNASTENLDHPFEVRLSIRSDENEGYRFIKLWRQTGIGGHEMQELVYRPGAISDTAIFTAHFQLGIEIIYRGKVLDSQTQSFP